MRKEIKMLKEIKTLKELKGYLLKDSDMVVLHKSDINNAKDEEFEEVSLFINTDDIKKLAEEIESAEDEEDF